MTPSHPLDAGRARSRAAAGLLSVLTVLSVGLVGFTGSAMAAGHAGETRCRQPQWIGAYAAAMAVPSTSVNFGFETKAFADQTLRMIVSPHVPGAKLRLRFTNQFGKQAVTFDGVHVGLQHADGPDVVPGSNRPVTFSGGGNAVSIPAGGAATSDPLEFRVEPFRHLAVSFHVVGGPVALDMHPEANQRSFRTPEASGDHAGDESGGAFTESSTAAYALEQIEVLNAGPVTTVVTLGDSITDGAGSTHGADRRYPDILQRRLLAAGRSISVLNVGIGGNQITRSSALAGPSGVERFTHDVAERPGVTDVIVMGPQGRVLVTGPDVVRTVTGQDVDAERLGGPDTHARSGVVHLSAETDAQALQRARLLVDLLARQGSVDVRRTDGPDPGALVPSEHRLAYDVRPVVRAVVDPGTFVEVQEGWARNVVTGLARLAGRTVGVVANNPIRMAGCLDASSGDKAGRFVQWCDGHGVPLVFLVDVPGYLPGVGQEDAGVVRRGAKLLHAYAACVVPRLTVVLRKSFGGAFIAMGSKGLGADAVYAWPGAQVDVMGASAAVEVLHRRELAAEPDPARRAELVLRLSAAHEATTGGLARALGSGVVDEILAPEQTRARLVTALAALPNARGRHRNPPL